MQRSERYILTTHAGSLPRPPGLVDMYVRLSRREPVDAAALAAAVEESTQQVVRRQLEAGVDVGNDGEQARESFFTYVQHRMSGFGGTSDRPVMRDIVHYRTFLELKLPEFARPMVNLTAAPKAIGEVRYVDRAPLEQECARYLRILAAEPRRFTESFMTAASPGIVAAAMLNEHYPRYEDYVVAVADALRTEYEYVVSQGFVLSMANPRHAHEHRVLARHPLPDGMLLVAGVIDTTTNYVEHPEVVADRLERATEAVGDPRRVLAGTDCGFATAAGLGEVAEEVVWEKLRALRAGADLATRRLLG